MSQQFERPQYGKEADGSPRICFAAFFSNDAIGTVIATLLASILLTPDGRGTVTTSAAKALIDTSNRSAISTPIAPAARKAEFDNHMIVKYTTLGKVALESLNSYPAGGALAVRCPYSMTVQ